MYVVYDKRLFSNYYVRDDLIRFEINQVLNVDGVYEVGDVLEVARVSLFRTCT